MPQVWTFFRMNVKHEDQLKGIKKWLNLHGRKKNEDHVLLMVKSNFEEAKTNSQYWNCGCSNHMRWKRNVFFELYESITSKVSFTNNNIVSTK